MFKSFDRWSKISIQWNPAHIQQKARSPFTEARNGLRCFHLSIAPTTPSHTFQPSQQAFCVEEAKVILPSREMFEIQVAGRKMQNWFGKLLLQLREPNDCRLMSKPLSGFDTNYDVCPSLCQQLSQSASITRLIRSIDKSVIPTLTAMTTALGNRRLLYPLLISTPAPGHGSHLEVRYCYSLSYVHRHGLINPRWTF